MVTYSLRQCFSEKWRNVGECWHFSFFIFSCILVHLAYWRIIFFSQSTCKAPKKSVLKIDPPLYSISFCSFSRDYLWTSFEPNRSTGKDNLQRVINEIVWKFAHIIRRGISMEWPRVFCLKCFFSFVRVKNVRKSEFFWQFFTKKWIFRKPFKISKIA